MNTAPNAHANKMNTMNAESPLNDTSFIQSLPRCHGILITKNSFSHPTAEFTMFQKGFLLFLLTTIKKKAKLSIGSEWGGRYGSVEIIVVRNSKHTYRMCIHEDAEEDTDEDPQ